MVVRQFQQWNEVSPRTSEGIEDALTWSFSFQGHSMAAHPKIFLSVTARKSIADYVRASVLADDSNEQAYKDMVESLKHVRNLARDLQDAQQINPEVRSMPVQV